MLHYLEVGGSILWVLVLISIGAFAVILERLVFFSKNEKGVCKCLYHTSNST